MDAKRLPLLWLSWLRMTPEILQTLAAPRLRVVPRKNGSPSGRRSGVQLDKLLREMEPEIRCLVRPGIEVLTGSTSARFGLRAAISRREAESLLRHLVIDACDAMPAGGLLSLVTGQLILCPGSGLPELPAGTYVTLDARDTGSTAAASAKRFSDGASPLLLKKGRALGLGACYEALSQGGGGLFVSRAGNETIVRVYLPAQAAEAA